MIRILIADDHQLTRDRLHRILSDCGDFEVVAESHDRLQTLDLVTQLQPDIVLLEIAMPNRAGLELLRLLHQCHPAVRVLIVTIHSEQQYALPALQLGARGFLNKEMAPDLLAHAIRSIHNGGIFLSAGLLQRLGHVPASTSAPVNPPPNGSISPPHASRASTTGSAAMRQLRSQLRIRIYS